MTLHWKTPALFFLGFILGTISVGIVYAWTGPTQSPPNGNVSAPVNVGTIDQVKAGGLGGASREVNVTPLISRRAPRGGSVET